MQDFETRNGLVDIRELLSLRKLLYLPVSLFNAVMTVLSLQCCPSMLVGDKALLLALKYLC